jgi:hypothetical protein
MRFCLSMRDTVTMKKGIAFAGDALFMLIAP